MFSNVQVTDVNTTTCNAKMRKQWQRGVLLYTGRRVSTPGVQDEGRVSKGPMPLRWQQGEDLGSRE